MTTSDVFGLQRSGLNDFLFAHVGTETNGMTLSMLSVFARQGSDPWREAGRLAELPKAEATASLARTIATMPQTLWSLADATLIAARLISLLPPRPGKAEIRTISGMKDWRLSTRIAITLICAALVTGYALLVLL